MEETFGSFIAAKRLEKGITLRRFAWLLDISPVYVSSFEKGRKRAPKDEVVDRIALVLGLSQEDTNRLYDLAALTRNADTVSRDLSEYIMKNDVVRTALRTAENMGATDEEWLDFIEGLNKRSQASTHTVKSGYVWNYQKGYVSDNK